MQFFFFRPFVAPPADSSLPPVAVVLLVFVVGAAPQPPGPGPRPTRRHQPHDIFGCWLGCSCPDGGVLSAPTSAESCSQLMEFADGIVAVSGSIPPTTELDAAGGQEFPAQHAAAAAAAGTPADTALTAQQHAAVEDYCTSKFDAVRRPHFAELCAVYFSAMASRHSGESAVAFKRRAAEISGEGTGCDTALLLSAADRLDIAVKGKCSLRRHPDSREQVLLGIRGGTGGGVNGGSVGVLQKVVADVVSAWMGDGGRGWQLASGAQEANIVKLREGAVDRFEAGTAGPGERGARGSAARTPNRVEGTASQRHANAMLRTENVKLASAIVLPRHDQRPTQRRRRVLVLYQYAPNEHDSRLQNLDYFLRFGVTRPTTPSQQASLQDISVTVTYRITVNGDAPDAVALIERFRKRSALDATLPDIHLLQRENAGYDFGAHRDALAAEAARVGAEQHQQHGGLLSLPYDVFVMLNCGSAGPIYPRYMPANWHWTSAFVDKLTAVGQAHSSSSSSSGGGVALVGTSLKCIPPADTAVSVDASLFGPKVEGFAFAIAAAALQHELQVGTSFVQHPNKKSAIINGEYALSATVLAAPHKWNLDSLLMMHDGNVDWQNKDNWACNAFQHVSQHASYGDGIDIHPLEVLFHKPQWGAGDQAPISLDETTHYMKWRNAAPPPPALSADADAGGDSGGRASPSLLPRNGVESGDQSTSVRRRRRSVQQLLWVSSPAFAVLISGSVLMLKGLLNLSRRRVRAGLWKRLLYLQ